MIDKKEKKRIFENSRIISYFVIIFAGILQCTLPFTYFCDSGEYSCLLCGMRHAIDYILQFDFYNAYKNIKIRERFVSLPFSFPIVKDICK